MSPRKVSLGVTLAVAVVALATVCTLQFSERWRYGPDQPSAADAIVVLAGDPARAKHAADLYRLRYARLVYVVRPTERASPPEEDVNRGILSANGVPENHVRVFSAGATNTLAEATVASAELPSGINNVLVVTSPVHARRARIIFTDILGGRGKKVLVVSSREEAPWWAHRATAIQNATEVLKAFLYVLGVR